jgi:hypothetical protein
MFDPFLISGINPAILALLPFVVVALTLLVRSVFKQAGKEIPAWLSQGIAFVLSAVCVVGTFLLSKVAMPTEFVGWSSLLVSLFSLQMVVYEVIVKRVLGLLSK